MRPRALPARAYALFDAKGPENAARLRRILHLVAAVEPRDGWEGLRVLDLGCGEGLFALEAALHGARVTAIDGREERMAAGRALAAELGLANVEFIHADVRSHPFAADGPFDVVLCLGLLYHLDAPALFAVARRAAEATRRALILETHVAPAADETVEHAGERYDGWRYREHRADDAPEARRGRLLASLDDASSFWLTPASLLTLLRRVGFATVLECRVPLQPFEADDRRTLLALKGAAPRAHAFPWIDDASEAEVRRRGVPRERILFMPPLARARDDAWLDVVLALGEWVRARPDFVLGTRGAASPDADAPHAPGAAIWRRRDLDAYVGRLRRVPPLLAVDVLGAGADEAAARVRADGWLAGGVATVWIVSPAARAVLVASTVGVRRVGADGVLPEPAGLAGLAPRAGALLGLRR